MEKNPITFIIGSAHADQKALDWLTSRGALIEVIDRRSLLVVTLPADRPWHVEGTLFYDDVQGCAVEHGIAYDCVSLFGQQFVSVRSTLNVSEASMTYIDDRSQEDEEEGL